MLRASRALRRLPPLPLGPVLSSLALGRGGHSWGPRWEPAHLGSPLATKQRPEGWSLVPEQLTEGPGGGIRPRVCACQLLQRLLAALLSYVARGLS